MLCVYSFLIFIAITLLLPCVWLIESAFKNVGEIFSPTLTLIPKSVTLENFHKLITYTSFLRWLYNSIIISLSYMLLGVFLCSLAGYAFAKMNFKGRNILFLIVIATMSIPEFVTIIPVFALMARIGWLNTYWALIIPGVAHPFGIFIMRQYISSIPSEIIEAAIIDGSHEFQIYYKIIIPLSKPALAATAIFLFLTSWQAYIYPLILVQTSDMYTINLGIAQLFNSAMTTYQEGIDFGTISAASFISLLPILIIFIFLQKYYIAGLTGGAIKG
jgi:ABC-type glycerol-3-phosphate transport system permease component